MWVKFPFKTIASNNYAMTMLVQSFYFMESSLFWLCRKLVWDTLTDFSGSESSQFISWVSDWSCVVWYKWT